MTTEKIIIIGPEVTSRMAVAKKIAELDDSYVVAPTFTSDLSMQDKITDDFVYYLSLDDIQLAFKNNAFMFVNSSGDDTVGITYADMCTSDLFVLSFEDFNNVSTRMLDEIRPVICWIDTKKKSYDAYKKDLTEAKYVIEKIDSREITTLYFNEDVDDVESIANTMLTYMTGDKVIRAEILEENS